jgi:hypothetical protein
VPVPVQCMHHMQEEHHVAFRSGTATVSAEQIPRVTKRSWETVTALLGCSNLIVSDL